MILDSPLSLFTNYYMLWRVTMENSKAKGFGARGWLLIVVLFTSFMMFQVFTNFPLNILKDFYGGDKAIAPIMSIGTFIGIVLQIIISSFVGRIKSIKRVAAVVGCIALLSAIVVAAVPVKFNDQHAPQVTIPMLWYAAYLLVNVCSTMYALFFLSILAGQWFPTRKGTVMGIATIAYPFCNGVIGFFAATALTPLDNGKEPAIFMAFLPFIIVCAIGYLLFLVGISDYPEQVGAYRDNDKNLTPEIAKKMMEEEIENKKTSVWHTGHTFISRDFWFASVTCGLILMAAIGTMVRSQDIIAYFPKLDYKIIMLIVAIFGAIGSWLLGVLDTAVGTKKSMLLATCLMILAGILGTIAAFNQIGVLATISMVCIAMSMGASSNYTVSVAAQYWRREDFQSVFACLNPLSNIFNALAAVVVTFIINSNSTGNNIPAVFAFVGILGVVAFILMSLFSAKHVKETDDKYREAAGKPLDDALVGRK